MNKIDIAAAIRSSESRLIRSMPGFMVSLIRKLIREDEMNATLEKTGMKNMEKLKTPTGRNHS